MRKPYEEPAAEELLIQMEASFLSVGNKDFDEDNDDIFGDGND
jgi:hypothetical protein